MGIFTQKIEVGSIDFSRFETVELMVDTGSTYTWIPRKIVEILGLKVVAKRPVRLADGRTIEKDAAEAPIKLNGETRTNLCLVADSGDALLLGSLTLETFSLGVDPINKKLVPVVSFAAGSI